MTLGEAAREDADDEPQTALCLFTDSTDPSGMGEHMLTLAAELCGRYRVLFVCPPGEKGDGFLERAEALGCTALPLLVQGNQTAVKTLQEWLRKLAVEIFHCHAGIGWEGHDGIRAAHESGVKVIVRTEHLPYLLTDAHQRADYAAILPLIDQLICVSEEAAQSYRRAGIAAEQLSVVRNGIRPQRVESDRVGVRAEFGLPPEAKLLLTVARMTEQKGHRYLLDALPQILDAAPEVYFLWVGEGPLEEELRQQAEALPIDPSHLILAGRRSDVPRLLAAADLFVLPSLFEGLPLVILEALANNVPIVATRVCGTSEAIKDGWNGRLVAAEDSPALATAIVEALTNPSLTVRWTHAGRTRFEQEFSAARMADETAACYEALRRQAQANAGQETIRGQEIGAVQQEADKVTTR